MRECENENEELLLFKESKKENCNINDNCSGTQRQSYLKSLESKHSTIDISFSNNTKKYTTKKSEMDSSYHESDSIVENVNSTQDFPKKKVIISTPDFCSSKKKTKNNIKNKSNKFSEMDSSSHESHSILENVRMINKPPVKTYTRKSEKKTVTVPEIICQNSSKFEHNDSSLLIDLKNNYASDDEKINDSLPKREDLCSSKTKKKRIYDDVVTSENELDTADLDETKDVSMTYSHQVFKSISYESSSNTKKKSKLQKEKELLDDESRKKLEQMTKSILELSENKNDTSNLTETKDVSMIDSHNVVKTISDISSSNTKNYSKLQKEKELLDDESRTNIEQVTNSILDKSESKDDTLNLDERKDVSMTDSHEMVKTISNKSSSNAKKKSKLQKDKELLTDKSRKKLEQLMKSALEKSDNKKDKYQKTNHAHEIKPKDVKEDFKAGDKVLVTSYNGEVTGPFVIVQLLGKLSCKIRLVNAVSSGENGLFADENEVKPKTEWLNNLIPFKKKTDSLKNSIISPCSDEHTKSDESETIFPKKKQIISTPDFPKRKQIISTPDFYSSKNKIKINIKNKSKKLKKKVKNPFSNEESDSDYKCNNSFTENKSTPKTKIYFSLRKKEKEIPKKVEIAPVVEWIKSLKLNSSHKEIILEEELTTDIIDTANQLIRKKWPYVDGLRTPFQVQSSTGFPAMKNGGVQIIFDEDRHHWFTASNMRGHVEIADSMVPDSLSLSAKQQIVQCFRDYEENGILKVHMLPVCQQDNEVDCGLYAIANAIEFICEHGDPLNQYIRDDIRKHLAECFEKEEIQRFPKATLGTAKRSVNQPSKAKIVIIKTNKILERCDRAVKRTANKPATKEIIVELISSDSE